MFTILSDLRKQARDIGADHGWQHANFCDAYGWEEHGGQLTGNRSPREFTRYLMAGTGRTVDMSATEYEVLCLDMYSEYINGFIEGIQEYEADTREETLS